MGRLIFLDVDGTIVSTGHPPSKTTVEAVRAARANGHKVFLSTGRREADIPESVRLIGFDGGIYSAGGRVVVNGTEILNRPMSKYLVQQATDILQEWNLYFILESASGAYVGTKNQTFSDTIGKMIQMLQAELHMVDQKRRPEQDPVYKIVFLAESNTQIEQVVRRLSETATIVYSSSLFPGISSFTGEISNININKGTALACICQHLDVDLKDCIAFGDSMNDVEILQAAGIGIAMGNAETYVKEIADQVCESCEEDGIAKALARMHLTSNTNF